jgi:formate dehydrogenase iron-sulfur subunit
MGIRKAQKLRADGFPNTNFYGEDEMGGLHTLYVLTERPSVYGLPEAPELATSAALTKWLIGLVTAGVVAAVPLWLVFRRKKQLREEQQSKVEGGVK